jgi:nicotinamidase-related amidase
MNRQEHIPTALLAVDVQPDFMPGGSLAVPAGDEVIEPLVAAAACADLVVATRDWHPAEHISFAERGGPWPPHCIATTPGAAIAPAIDRIADMVVSKGMDPEVDAYSGFDGTGLAATLRPRARGWAGHRLLRARHRTRRTARGVRDGGARRCGAAGRRGAR